MNRIKELRRKFPMSQAELAKALHVSQASISGYEQGNYEPDFELTKQMADLFGVSIEYLLGLESEEHTEPEEPAREPTTEWNVQYPAGVALRTAAQPGIPMSLSEADINRIAEKVARINQDAKTSPILNSSEQQLIEEYRMLSTAQKIRVQRMIGTFLDNKFMED